MGNHKDKVKEVRKSQRDNAVHFAELWINMKLEQYREPTRSGRRRGEPIGHSRKKHHAVLSMVLYPTCLKLRQIAKRIGVSEGLLRVWRTEARFKKKVEWACQSFGEIIAREIEITINKLDIDDIRANGGEFILQGDLLKILKSKKDRLPEMLEFVSEQGIEIKEVVEIDDTDTDILGCVERFDDPWEEILLFWVRFLPFFYPSVAMPVLELLRKNLNKSFRYLLVMLAFHREFFVYDEKTLRKWEARPEMLQHTKDTISDYIDLLTDPEAKSQFTPEEIGEKGKELKKYIVDKLDILAQ